MNYEVQTLTHPDTWENTWSDSLNDTPVQFDSYEASEAELADFLNELTYAVKNNYMGDFNKADYRIKKL
jgi:hypothetical protein